MGDAGYEEGLNQSLHECRVLDGFLRRICKLLFFGIKPVFVFDGRTPALKAKTLRERRATRFGLVKGLGN